MKYDIARSLAMFWIVGVYHLSEYINSPLHTLQWARMVTWGCLGAFTFISAYFLAGKNTFENKTDVISFYKKRLLRFYPLFFLSALTMFLTGFNDGEQTWKGVLGLSTFLSPQINTLWYISMLIGFYLLTPLLQRRDLKWKLTVYVAIMILALLIQYLLRTGIDNRFFYYFTVYTAGVIFSRHVTLTVQTRLYSSRSLLFCGMTIYALCMGWVILRENYLGMMFGGFLGTFLLISFSNVLSRITGVGGAVHFLSYGSMAAYLFHRQIYYVGLTVYDPSDEWSKGLYLALVLLPAIFIISYYIQAGYDRLCSARRLQ